MADLGPHLLGAALIVSLFINVVTITGSDWSLAASPFWSTSTQESANAGRSRLALTRPARTIVSGGSDDTHKADRHEAIGTRDIVAERKFTSALFIVYSWNYDVFLTSLKSYVAAGFAPQIVILDNSRDRRALKDIEVVQTVAEVIPTRTKLSFSQLQNFIADIAIERGYDYYFWGHSDVAVLASNSTVRFADEIFGCMDKVMGEQQLWGLVKFGCCLDDSGQANDWFLATRTEVSRHVLYDIFIPVYKADCDYFPRVEAAGWEIKPYWDVCPELAIKTYDLNRPVRPLPVHNHKRMEEVLEDEKNISIFRNDWKNKEMDTGEKIGWDLWEEASTKYFRLKWKLPDFDGMSCKFPLSSFNNETGREELLRPWTDQ